MDTIKILESIVQDSEGGENLEKLDYLKNLQAIREKLRTKIYEKYNNSVGHWSLDVESKNFHCSSLIEHLYTDTTHPKHPLKRYHKFSSTCKEDLEVRNQEIKIKKNGKNYFIKESVSCIKEKALLLGTVQDLTTIKTLQKNLENIDKISYQLMELFDKNIIFFQCDKSGIVTYVSDALAQISGFDAKEILGKPLSAYQNGKEESQLEETLKKLKKSNLSWKGELTLQKKKGEFFWLKAFISPIYNPDNKLTYFTIICHDITPQKMLEQVTNYDPLTNIHNRRYYNEIIPQEINRAKRDGKEITFAMIDIDFFKQYNDIYGHIKGDETLIKVAQALNEGLKRGEDFLFRMGGEEFCVIFSGLNTEASIQFCNKLKEKIEALKIPHQGSKVSKYITISIGLVVADVKNEVIDELGLYTIADNALYSAKSEGRNRVFLHPVDEMDIF